MPPAHPVEAVIVSDRKFESDDAYDIIDSNVSYLSSQFEQHLNEDEVSRDALRSYYVDYYLSQLENGGFSQFVYNSDWGDSVVELVLEGLEAMGAVKHLQLLKQAAALLDQMGPERLEEFLEGEYFGDNPDRDMLSTLDEQFFAACEEEDLIQLNAQWLRQLPNLVVLSVDEMQAELDRRVAVIPDLEQRVAESLENEPRFAKLIRALCDNAGHQLEDITAGDPAHELDGECTVAWHFLTDQGHFYMVESGAQAMMFAADSDQLVSKIEATEEYGTD